MMEYIHMIVQASLDAVTMYVISSFLLSRGWRGNKQSFLWILWFLLFCMVSQFTFVASGSVQFSGVKIENYSLLPVNSWVTLVFLFFTVLILNTSFFRTSNVEAIYVTVLSFMIWIIIRLVSVITVGLFVQNTLADRIISLLIALALLITPLDSLLKAIRGRNLFTKLVLLNSFFILAVILVLTKFSQALVLQNAGTVAIALLCIISLSLWVLNEQRKSLLQENRLTVIEQYLPVIDDLVTEMRVKQHEFNNKLLAISGIIETEQNVEAIREKVREYTEYTRPKEPIQQLLSMEHKVIAGFLYAKMKLAEWKNIKISADIRTGFTGFQSNEYDWIEALGILLDNAIEASLPLDEIKVTLRKSEEMLELSVSNPSSYITNAEFRNMLERGYTTKAQGSNHRGYGLLALKQLIGQHGGNIIAKNEELNGKNYVTIGVLLP